MTETNELQPTPENEVQAAEVQTAPAPEATATQAEEIINVPEEEPETAPVEDAAPAEETPETQAEPEAAPEEPAPEEPAIEEPAAEEPAIEEPAAEGAARPLYETKEQVVDRLREIQEEDKGGDKNELDLLKQVFYKLHKAAQMAARNAFIEEGGAPEDWRAEVDAAEENFKAIMANIRQRRAEIAEALEKQKEENLDRKLAIIERF